MSAINEIEWAFKGGDVEVLALKLGIMPDMSQQVLVKVKGCGPELVEYVHLLEYVSKGVPFEVVLAEKVRTRLQRQIDETHLGEFSIFPDVSRNPKGIIPSINVKITWAKLVPEKLTTP